MARSRLLKPGFFTNEHLVELDPYARLLFAGLWTLADREGRMEDRPRRIKIELFPMDDIDIDALLEALQAAGFIRRYEVAGARYLDIPSFTKHQHLHKHEAPSFLPSCPDAPSNDRTATANVGSRPADTEADRDTDTEAEAEESADAPPPPAPRKKQTMAQILQDGPFLEEQRAIYTGNDYEWDALVDNWRDYRSDHPPKGGGWYQCFRNEVLRQNRYLESLGRGHANENGRTAFSANGAPALSQAASSQGWPEGTPL